MNWPWQPIESAPKDGESVILHEPHEEPTVGWWSRYRHKWVALRSGYDENIDDNTKPTHWMPLPSPPQS